MIRDSIELNKNKLYRNKTFTYLLPIIKDYGADFVNNFKNLEPVAYTIGDIFHDSNFCDNNYLYITCTMNSNFMYNKNVFSKDIYLRFQKFREILHSYSCYVDEYPQGDIKENIYTFVISLPKEYDNIKHNFIQGMYSKLYTPEQLERLIPKIVKNEEGIESYTRVYQILKKTKEYKPLFLHYLNKEFGTNLTLNDIDDDREYDFKPQLHQEVLNYYSENREFYKKDDE